ncbi:MAG: TetR/AcrR family transcriptional repressor of nem operon [Pseudohongiellaceae bacterium]|jgi:TetR/AcrR family transcriptional repressor of nem operon
MARPRRSEQTREALITAGIDQISMHGYYGTGIKQILDIVNVPKGSFYNFFNSKEAFVAELIKQYSQNSLAKLNTYLQTQGANLSPVEQLRDIYKFGLSEFANSQYQKSCLVGALAADIGAESVLCQKALNKAMSEWLEIFSTIFEHAQKVGELRTDVSAKQLSSTYWSTWEGSLLKLKVTSNAQAAADTMELMLSTFFKAPQ